MIAVSSLPLYVQCPRAFYLKATLPAVKKEKKPNHHGSAASSSAVTVFNTRTMMLESQWLSLRGQCRFLVEDGISYPSVFRKRAGGKTEADSDDILKLSCYSLLLDNCPDARIVYTDSSQVRKVQITDPMRNFAQTAAKAAAEVLAGEEAPKGRKGEHCRICHYRFRCETRVSASKPENTERHDDLWIIPESEETELPTGEKRLPLYLQEQGTKLGIEGGVFQISREKDKLKSIKTMDVSQICVFGNIQVTTQAFRKAFDSGIPILFFTAGGTFSGTARGLAEYNAKARLAQFKAMFDEKRISEIALQIVTAKVSNCRTVLRRNTTAETSAARELTALLKRLPSAPGSATLRGIEGTAARMYFGEFSCMFKNRALSEGFDFNSRNRRPPKDPVNSLLSFGYALLAKEFTVAIDASGLDPMHGYYHAGRSMRPALALDLMEPFRPLISDSLAITCINRGMLKKEDFVIDTKGCHMKPGARKKYLEAYENRLNTKVSYNGSGAISYRNAIRKAIQDFKSYILDKSPAYMPLVVR